MSVQKKDNKRGTARPGFIRGSWREKVNPIFADWCSSQKKSRELSKIRDPQEFDRKFKDWLKEFAPRSRAINEAWSTIKNSAGAKLLDEISRGLKFHDLSDPEGGDDEQGSVMPLNPECHLRFSGTSCS
jgi:hypothetical protein